MLYLVCLVSIEILNPKVEFKYQKFKRFREFSFCLKHLTIISVKH
ncbi:hypothetical protein FLAVO9R_100129 [Flavobacterium sp. 9R]|nr:hypothetical protein FLAVO9R_100129 [Flavobacterium sp. 9R]